MRQTPGCCSDAGRRLGRASARRHRARGWSLLELLVVLVVLAIVTTQAVPAFEALLARNRLAISSNEILGALVAARQTAVSRNVAVSFCAGSPQAGCHGDWSRQEWMAFIDQGRDGRLDPGDELRSVYRLTPTARLVLAANGPFGKAIVFRSSGLARSVTGAFAAGRVRVCMQQPIKANATDLVLIGSGRVEPEPHDFSGRCPPP